MNEDGIQIDEAGDVAAVFDSAAFWHRFQHRSVTVDGVQLHYVEGGDGDPLLLLPGWPQSWYAWRLVMPMLANAGRRVIALDPRGMGDSDRPAAGYDMHTVAAEIHGFVAALGLAGPDGLDVAGHDLGTWIAYAHASDWPGDVRRLAVMDAALPGITTPPPAGIPTSEANARTWHFGFNRLDDLPELLIEGRERAYLTWLFQSKSVRRWQLAGDALDEYVRVMAAPGALRAAFNYYRAAFSPEQLEASRRRAETPLGMSVLALGAQTGVGDVLLDTMRRVATDVRGGTLVECGHYMAEERPSTVANALIGFFGAGQ